MANAGDCEDTISERFERAVPVRGAQVSRIFNNNNNNTANTNSLSLLLKTQLIKRQPDIQQLYTQLCDCPVDGQKCVRTNEHWNGENKDEFAKNLDRLPRFRFGGNRGTGTAKVREREKKYEQDRLKELTDRLKIRSVAPIPPPRTKQNNPRSPPPQTTQSPPLPNQNNPTEVKNENETILPHRSASFSIVDYSIDDNKYVRRKHQSAPCDKFDALTFPRNKRPTKSPTPQENPKQPQTDEAPTQSETNHEPPTKEISFKTDPNPTSDAKEKKRDKFRKRKGMYISEWQDPYEYVIPQFVENGEFASYTEHQKPEHRTPSNLEQTEKQPNEKQPPEKTTTEIPRLQVYCETSEANPPEKPTNEESLPESERPEETEPKPKIVQLHHADSLSESELDPTEKSLTLASSDISDCESRSGLCNDSLTSRCPRRYSKRPLRGPYGQMLEAEMKKPEADRKNLDLKFLEDLSPIMDARNSDTRSVISLSSSSSVGAGDPKPTYVTRIRGASNYFLDDSQLKMHSARLSPPVSKFSVSLSPSKRKTSVDASTDVQTFDKERKPLISHQRTTSSPSKLEGTSSIEVSGELLEQLLKGSSEQLATAEANLQKHNVSSFLLFLLNLVFFSLFCR